MSLTINIYYTGENGSARRNKKLKKVKLFNICLTL